MVTEQTTERVSNLVGASYSPAARSTMYYAIADSDSFAAECADMRDYARGILTHKPTSHRDAKYTGNARLHGLNLVVTPEATNTQTNQVVNATTGKRARVSNARPLDSWLKVFLADCLAHPIKVLAHDETIADIDVSEIDESTLPNIRAYSHMVRVKHDELVARLSEVMDVVTRRNRQPLSGLPTDKDSGLDMHCVNANSGDIVYVVLTIPGMQRYVCGYSNKPVAHN